MMNKKGGLHHGRKDRQSTIAINAVSGGQKIEHDCLKVLSSEMDPAESRLIR